MTESFNLAGFCLAENAARRGAKTALILTDGTSERRLTYEAFDLAVRRLAAGLSSLGLPTGARVMIRRGNDLAYVLSFFALIAAGLVALPSSAQLTQDEADFLAADSGAAAAICSGGLAVQGTRIIGDEELARLSAFPPRAYAATAPDDPAYLIYTSGTSDRPKGVLHAQRVILGRAPVLDHWLGLTESDIVLHAGAINWTYTLGVGLMDPFARGAAAVLYNGPAEASVWPTLIARFSASIFAAVPGVYRQMLRQASCTRDTLASLRHGVVAGEALKPALLEQWREKSGKPLYEALGMSEISTYISSGPTVPTRPGSPGKPQPGRRVAILPLDGGERQLPAGERGLIAVHRSDPGLMLSYWRRPEAEREVFRGAWFVGGDVAELDADGYVWLHGRADDLMNAQGYRVSPAEVEASLSHAPGVADVAAVERKVREDVSVICAFVVLAPGAAPDEAVLRNHCAEHLAAYKNPKKYVFVSDLPRTKNGKIARRLLPEIWAPPAQI
ncbi:AMP-binding protein [Rhodoblastus acidophilus]|uniref:AMP-binding protein n=1 Tax=Candidatus Rhodoblastus alkanivorans TaxID=2954117 RepID=A0ABS9Z6B6_9HYPH|nr:AMP-binding protein [Candidatus Rhodoblastus alkanivorans]MCI4678788.1 AMP-binding protein [Candidatus Rhodoblastus alkanivorans]MCI4682177.1 AMP-binding protein [Candidatus Rhodoblastus alkanivorans]MDI4639479.1 AMP-binding protein [Rhodoblastus acidophilus]